MCICIHCIYQYPFLVFKKKKKEFQASFVISDSNAEWPNKSCHDCLVGEVLHLPPMLCTILPTSIPLPSQSLNLAVSAHRLKYRVSIYIDLGWKLHRYEMWKRIKANRFGEDMSTLLKFLLLSPRSRLIWKGLKLSNSWFFMDKTGTLSTSL